MLTFDLFERIRNLCVGLLSHETFDFDIKKSFIQGTAWSFSQNVWRTVPVAPWPLVFSCQER